jgi:hypothetical protein
MKSIIAAFFIGFHLLNLSAQTPEELFVEGVKDPVISLNGQWQINTGQSGKYSVENPISEGWENIQVPGEPMMQGFIIKHDKPFSYKKELEIPRDFKNKLIKIKFEGVYSFARVWVNGKYIRDHEGGFTEWECDITSAVTPGKSAILIVEVTDKADDISYASGYAKHPIGGILRSVSLMAIPAEYPNEIIITTDFDDDFQNAVLSVGGTIKPTGGNQEISIELFDKELNKIEVENPSIRLTGNQFQIKNNIVKPVKWDAEHPDLYQLKLSYKKNGKKVWQSNYAVGFREIEIKGNRFLVNGREVRLRGACRHDMHPLLGRVSTPDYELMDVKLAKESNMNFIRTSHYPPSGNFLKLCDEYGIFVEVESAICFVGTHRTKEYAPAATENDSGYTNRYMSQLKEMVNSHRNHPSVIIWSMGNESAYGSNFQKSYDWTKKEDPTRPVVFSYPGFVPKDQNTYDILSMHYPEADGSMSQFGAKVADYGYDRMPVLFDEWIHVPAYNSHTISEDPNVRDFWGMSLDNAWRRTYDSDGGLGGAIWGMTDETFMLPVYNPPYVRDPEKEESVKGTEEGKISVVGYGEWGIIDTWRRKKPEFWNTKKAYSPVRILTTEFDNYQQGKHLEVPVYNRFDVTNLNELTITYTQNGITSTLTAPDIQPREKGFITIPFKAWSAEETIQVDFYDHNKLLIDREVLRQRVEYPVPEPAKPSGTIRVQENGTNYTIVCNENLKIFIDKSTGLFSAFEATGVKHSFKGPFLNLRTSKHIRSREYTIINQAENWKLAGIEVKDNYTHAELIIRGDYDSIAGIRFNLTLFPDGSVVSNYFIPDPPGAEIREAGIYFSFGDMFDSLSWKRDAFWSWYPPGHLSAPEGKVPIYSNNLNVYRTMPGKAWELDTKSFFYDGTDSETVNQILQIAKATKENITEYKLTGKNGGSIVVEGIPGTGCRIGKIENDIGLYINSLIDYPDLSWGNFERNITLKGNYEGKAIIRIASP